MAAQKTIKKMFYKIIINCFAFENLYPCSSGLRRSLFLNFNKMFGPMANCNKFHKDRLKIHVLFNEIHNTPTVLLALMHRKWNHNQLTILICRVSASNRVSCGLLPVPQGRQCPCPHQAKMAMDIRYLSYYRWLSLVYCL